MQVKVKQILQTALALVVAARLIFPLVIIAQVEGNNSGSENSVAQETTSTQTTNQSSVANIATSVNVSLSTGNNSVNGSSGNSSISTGDTSLAVQVENQANTSVVESGCCATATPAPAKIADNNTDSTNTISTTSQTETNINISQTATVTNKVTASLNTGGNKISDSSGTSNISTGDVRVQGKIVNGPINVAQVKVSDSPTQNNSVITSNNLNTQNIIYQSYNKNVNISTDHWANIANFVSILADTGSNTITNNLGMASITTGDIFFSFKIENGPINVSYVEYGCCSCENPNPINPTVTPTITPTPTPTPTSSIGNGGGGSSSTGGGSEVQRVAAMVLGATGSFWENMFYLTFFVGCLFLSFGIRSLRNQNFSLAFANAKEKLRRQTGDFFKREIVFVFQIF